MSSWLIALRTGNRIATSLPLRLAPHAIRLSRKFGGFRSYSSHAPPPLVTKIEKILLEGIKTTGPLPFTTYMQLCLSHPTDGYYMNPLNPVFGSRGDFITSPEISQVFGELVGIWLLSQWMNAGRPPAVRLVELGPGRGTLMDDILRVIAQFTKANNPLRDIHLVETSQAMRSLQEEKIRLSVEKAGCKVHWHNSIDNIPLSNEYTMLVAHEFFDALPIRILQKTEEGWKEVLVDSNLDFTPSVSAGSPITNPSTSSICTVYPRFRRVLSPNQTAATLVLGLSSPRFKALPIGSTIEVSPASFVIARKVGELLSGSGSPSEGETTNASPGGCGLIVDYGGAKAYGDSFRAFKDHKIVDVFHQPGECDLTANVDFAYLQEAMGDLVTTHGPISQSSFLERMGLQLRVDALVRNANTEERGAAIRGAAQRLVDRTGMGKEYQVMGITSKPGEGAPQDTWPFVNEPQLPENQVKE